SIWRPRHRERARLSLRIVRSHSNARNLGAGRTHPRELDVDHRDRVAFEVDVRSLSGGDGDQLAIGPRLDAEGTGLDGDAWRDFDDWNACQRPLEVHHGHVIRARVSREKESLSVAAAAQGEELRVRPATE